MDALHGRSEAPLGESVPQGGQSSGGGRSRRCWGGGRSKVRVSSCQTAALALMSPWSQPSLSLSPLWPGHHSTTESFRFAVTKLWPSMGDPPKPPDASSLPMPKFMRPRPDPSPFLAPTNAGPAPTNAARRKGSVVSSHDGQSEVPALVMRDAVQGLKPALPTCLLPACMLPTYLPTCLLLPRTWRGSRWRTV